MYSPLPYYNDPQTIAYEMHRDLDDAQRRLEQQYFDQSLARTPYNPLEGRPIADSEYKRAYGTPDPAKWNQELNLRYAGQNTLQKIPFSGSTAYQEHYQRHSHEALTLNPQLYNAPAPVYPHPRIRFQGESTYKAAYRNSDIMDRMRALNSQKINRREYWSQPHAPFNGSSSYKAHFQPFQVQPKSDRSFGPQPPPLKFDGKSTYKSDFESFKVELPQRCPVERLPVPYPKAFDNSSRHLFYDAFRNSFK